jgi:8-oxo-dGTP pyrophosphatase MutT (NUDIX family)
MPKELKTTVTAFIFHDNKLLFVKHKKLGLWLHVGGHVENNETLDEALEREIKEEVNLKVSFIENYHYQKASPKHGFKELPRPFYIHKRDSGSHRKMSFDFVCIAKDIRGLKILASELEGYKWMSEEQVKKSKELWKPIKLLALKAFEIYNSVEIN